MWSVWGEVGYLQGLVLNPKIERGPLKHLGLDITIMLKWVLRKSAGRPWTRLIWLRIWTVSRLFEDSNKPSGFIKFREFIELLRPCQPLERILLHGVGSWIGALLTVFNLL